MKFSSVLLLAAIVSAQNTAPCLKDADCLVHDQRKTTWFCQLPSDSPYGWCQPKDPNALLKPDPVVTVTSAAAAASATSVSSSASAPISSSTATSSSASSAPTQASDDKENKKDEKVVEKDEKAKSNAGALGGSFVVLFSILGLLL